MVKACSTALILTVLIVLLGPPMALAKAPPWYSSGNGLQRSAKALTITCTGDGSSTDLARRLALKSCIAMAVDQLTASYHVQSVTVQTETESALHEEVQSSRSVTGLTCNPVKEAAEETEGRATVWLKCAFDLSAVKVVADSPKSEAMAVKSSPLVLENRAEKPMTDIATDVGTYSVSDRRVLNLSVIPSCNSILVQGKVPRVLTCSSNPFAVTVSPDDTALIIRAKGFKPRTLQLNSVRTPSNAEDTFEVILER